MTIGNFSMQRFLFSVLLIYILAFSLFSQSLKINEVMSSNGSTLADEDGDFSDWLEIYNNDATPIDLFGYSLSDNLDSLSKWSFGNRNIEPHEFLLVFASDKDRHGEVFYWKNLIDWGDEWSFRLGTSEPLSTWNNLEFNDSAWMSGSTGIGYGDDDDQTIIEPVMSFYARKKFTIDNVDEIINLFLHIDFDDGFVAYLNGVEIARENIGQPGIPPAYDEPAISDEFEAKIYQGGLPDEYIIDEFQSLLTEGENILAIQIHNLDLGSSDLTFIPFLTVQLNSGINAEQPPAILNLPTSNIHTNFKIRSSGETLILTDPIGNIVDSVFTGLIPTDISRGRKPDGEDNWLYFAQPTPGSANSTPGSDTLIVSVKPQFSHQGGFYNEQFQLTMSTALSETPIYYTTNGSEPTAFSQKYIQPVNITSTMVVKAKTIDSFNFASETVTNTYFIDENRSLPVFSISTDPVNLFGEGGIYEGNIDREIPIYIEMYETTGELAFKHNAGAEVFGSGSSGFEQKSLSIFFRGMYGTGELEYQLFPDLPFVKYESFVLRNGGNDWWSTLIRDALSSNGLMERTNVDYQEYRPSIVFLNGDYWGIHNIREKVNEHFIKDHYYVAEDSLDMLQYKELVEPEIIHGDLENYDMMIDYLKNNSLTNSNNYEYVKSLIDIENYIDYQVIEQYCANIDWPANNNKFWRPRSSKGKWRWILFDTDTGYGLWDEWWAYGIPGWEVDHVAHAINEEGSLEEGWPNPPWSTFIFRSLLKNKTFENTFINRFADYLNTRLSPQNALNEIIEFHTGISSALPQHLQRWDRSQWDYNNELDKIKDFAAERPIHIRQHLMKHFSLSGVKNVTIKIEPAGSGVVKVNSLLISNQQWTGKYFSGAPITISASPTAGYKFQEWLGVLQESTSFSADPLILDEVTAVFEPDEGGSIVINEINYNSGNLKDPGDWIELFNDSHLTIDIGGWTIRDQSDSNSYRIPVDTKIESGQYLVLCRDLEKFSAVFTDVENIIGELNFGLSSIQDQTRLFNQQDDLVDSIAFSSQMPWPSEPNGNGPTLELINPNRDNSLVENWASSDGYGTPGRQNSKYDIKSEGTGEIISEPLKKDIINYPNPFLDQTTIKYRIQFANQVDIKIYNLLGQEVLTLVDALQDAGEHEVIWDGKNSDGIRISSGIYFYVFRYNYEIQAIEKMVKL
jgi:hypothetical protein